MNGKLARALRRIKNGNQVLEDVLRVKRNLEHKRDCLKTKPKFANPRTHKPAEPKPGLQGYTVKQTARLANKLPIVVRPVRAARAMHVRAWRAAAANPILQGRGIGSWRNYALCPKWVLNMVTLG